MSNIYYNPEKFGLRIIGEIEKEPEYDFDMLVVWQHNDGRLFYGQDSGCSCPSPFEDYGSLEELDEITKANWKQFRSEVEGFSYGSIEEKCALLNKVRGLLEGR